jgi:hypothetical protein
MIPGNRRKSRILFVPLLAALAGLASAQCPESGGKVEGGLKTYPLPSANYSVQYQIGNGDWTPATVYISYYGQTKASPYRNDSGYTAGTTSMSFTSIPALAHAIVRLRVTKLFGTPMSFQASDNVSLRPSVKRADVTLSDGIVEIATLTAADFNGEQFILWWNRGSDGGGVEGLAFFLNPPYPEPSGDHVKVVNSWADLTDPAINLPPIDTLDFEGQVELGNTGKAVYSVPSNIGNVFFGPTAWVQGKLQFAKSKNITTVNGPGVLDGSLFNYHRRNCKDANGTDTLSSSDPNGNLNNFVVDGIIMSDYDHAATDPFYKSTLNNVKTISWNGNNDALRLEDSTTATNVFIRSGDDSLMMWGSSVTVTNATVWQNYNGGVVNLGWLNDSPGDNDLLDGLYVVKADWLIPTANEWTAAQPESTGSTLNGQNNGVIVSLMTPTTSFGFNSPPVFRNIFFEDQPRVLFSLKIVPPVNCPSTGNDVSACDADTLMMSSYVSLNIENLHSPASVIANSIGFQSLPNPYTTQTGGTITGGFELFGEMDVNLTNVFIDGLPLLDVDSIRLGKISTHNSVVNVNYSVAPP